MTWRPGELLRRTAERVCSRRTMDLLVLPILADLQAEHADASASGRRWHAIAVLLQSYAAFWKAVAVHGAMTSVRHVRDNALATPTEQAVARRVLLCVAASLVVLTLLMSAYALRPPLPGKELTLVTGSRVILLLLPSILAVTIPMGFFLGVLLALTGPGRTAWPPVRHILALATLAAIVNFAGMAWIVPRSNQAFREAIYNALFEREGRWTPLSKGVRELTVPELSDAIRTRRPEGRDATPFEVEWQKRFALPAACLVLTLLAVGMMPRTRTAALALFAVVVFSYYLQLRIGEQSAERGAISPVMAMWSGNVLFATLGGLLLLKRRLGERSGAYVQG